MSGKERILERLAKLKAFADAETRDSGKKEHENKNKPQSLSELSEKDKKLGRIDLSLACFNFLFIGLRAGEGCSGILWMVWYFTMFVISFSYIHFAVKALTRSGRAEILGQLLEDDQSSQEDKQ